MRRFLSVLIISFSFSLFGFAQKPSCKSLTDYIEREGTREASKSHSSMTCSTFLSSVEFYRWIDPETNETRYYAICRIGSKKYIYSSSYDLMIEWNKYANSDQCSEAFNKYIKPYILDCS